MTQARVRSLGLAAALIPLVIATHQNPAAATRTASPPVTAVTAIGITVSDLPRALRFYRDVLDFRLVDEHDLSSEAAARLYGIDGARLRIATLRLGDERLELIAWQAPRGRPMPRDLRAASGPGLELLEYRSPRDGRAAPDIRPNDLAHWQAIVAGDTDGAVLLRDPDRHVLQLRPARP